MRSFLQKVTKTIRDYRMFGPKEKILLGVSGGVDSVCLMHLLKRGGYPLRILHVDHGLRGARSLGDASFVKKLSDKWNIPCTVVKARILKQKKQALTGWEEAGRQARYKAFLKYAKKFGCSKAATAHTLDDQAETVLFHLARGTSLKGLGGIPAVRPLGEGVNVVRPLLRISRQEILQYAKAMHLPWRQDESNSQERFARNKIRRRVMPVLESINPQFRQHIGQMAELVAAEEGSWDCLIHAILPQMTHQFEKKKLLDLNPFFSYPVGIQRRFLKAFLESSVPGVGVAHIQAAWQLIHKVSGSGSLDLGKAWRLEKQYKSLVLYQPKDTKRPWSALLPVPGRVSLAGPQKFLKAALVSSFPRRPEPQAAYFDWTFLQGQPLVVRYRRPGDRFRPDGLGGTQKLKKFLSNAKIPFSERDRVPLVCQGKEILWIAGQRRSDSAKVTEATKEILKIEYKQQGESQ